MVQNKNDNAVVIGMPLSCEVFMSPITSQIKSRLCVTEGRGHCSIPWNLISSYKIRTPTSAFSRGPRPSSKPLAKSGKEEKMGPCLACVPPTPPFPLPPPLPHSPISQTCSPSLGSCVARCTCCHLVTWPFPACGDSSLIIRTRRGRRKKCLWASGPGSFLQSCFRAMWRSSCFNPHLLRHLLLH